MKRRIIRYIKHLIVTIIIAGSAVSLFGIYHGASFHYSDNPIMMNWNNDGPYVFFDNDSTISVCYIKGNKNDGFYTKQQKYLFDSTILASCFFALDSSYFTFPIKATFNNPAITYNDNNPILAISDIESSYKTFRDFLIANKVIDNKLNWIYGSGHLVLVGDFMDRDFSTTQVLWFIYKLEQDAAKQKGTVHYILGNHELKNMQGNYESTSPKYYQIASILGKKQHELYDSSSFLGRWLASKNSIELINGTLFTHGGIHPNLANMKIDLKAINQTARSNYYKPYYPSIIKDQSQFLLSTQTGTSWYRGYFKESISQTAIDKMLKKFNATSIVVGHTLQTKVRSKYMKKVVGIDVKHPKDYHKSFPSQKSEGLLIENRKFYRVFHDGNKEEL